MPEIFAFGILEEFEDTKGVVTIHKSKQDRQQLTKWQTTINIKRLLNKPVQYLMYDNVKVVELFFIFWIK
jgi:hypothetical protein